MLLCIMSKLCRIDCNLVLKKSEIFYAYVQPIVLYGAELWGLESCSSVIDLFGLKHYLGVDWRMQMVLFMEKLEGFLLKLMQLFDV